MTPQRLVTLLFTKLDLGFFFFFFFFFLISNLFIFFLFFFFNSKKEKEGEGKGDPNRTWLKHMILDRDGFSDQHGICVRPGKLLFFFSIFFSFLIIFFFSLWRSWL